jgi:hypothetical protein
MLADIVATSLKPVLQRRGQTVVIVDHADRHLVVQGDLRLVFALLSAIMLEAAGLSSARARLRIALDFDEGDAIVTIIGSNSHHLPRAMMGLDRELADLAAQSGAELELMWDEHEGPTLVLRFPQTRTSASH